MKRLLLVLILWASAPVFHPSFAQDYQQMIKLIMADRNTQPANSDRAANDNFGYSVAISGTTAVVGARLQDYDPEGRTVVSDAGAAYVFIKSGSNWQFQQKLIAADRGASDLFGISVAISGETIVVGAHQEDEDASPTPGASITNAGSAYVFTRTAGVWSQQQKLVAADRGISDYFGISVAISGETIVVGAYLEDQDASPTPGATLTDAGSVYVFTRTGTTWTQQQKLVAADRAGFDYFGYSIAISGETIVVGAYQEDEDASATPGSFLNLAGSAYVFVRTGTTWSQQQKLVAADRGAVDIFGYSVSISGETIVIGAIGEDQDASPTPGATISSSGSAYVFTRTGTTWAQQQKLVAADRGDSDYFGISVAISGETIVVGAYFEDEDASPTPGNTLTAAGSAYVFVRTGTTWSQQQKLVAADRGANDNFGQVVAISGETIVAGVYLEDEDASPTPGNTLTAAGSAYVFTRTGTTWTQHQKLVASGIVRINGQQFGYSVAVSGNTAVVGAPLDDFDAATANPLANAGAVYVFVRSGTGWQFQQKLVAADRGVSDNFGYSVAISSETIVVGAPYEDEDASPTPGATLGNAGATYVFVRTGTTWTQQQKLVAADRGLTDNFGISVAISGETIGVGASGEDEDASPTPGATLNNSGSAYVFTRTGTTWFQQQKLVAADRGSNDNFARTVAVSGETLVVGASGEDEDGSPTPGNTLGEAGAAYVFVRMGTTWSQQQKLVAADRATFDYFGWSVAVSGETIVVGAYGEDEDASVTPGATLNFAGSAYVFTRTGTTWAQQQKLVAADRGVDDNFGYSVAISGETIVAGAYTDDEDASSTPGNTLSNAGSAYVFTRKGATWSQRQKLVAADRGALDNFGYSVSVSGATVIAGAYGDDEDASGANYLAGAGSAYVFEGPLRWTGTQSNDWNAAANWSPARVPSATDSISLPAATPFAPVLGSAASIAGLRIDAGQTLAISSGNSLSISAELINNGTVNGSGRLILSGATAQAISGKGIVTNLILSNAAGATVTSVPGSELAITGTYAATAGTLITNGHLRLVSNALGTARHASGTISGDVTVERYLPAKATRKSLFLATAVATTVGQGWQQQIHITGVGTGGTPCAANSTTGQPTANSNGFDATLTNNPSLFLYEDLITVPGAKWVSYADNTQGMWPGYGFRVLVRGPRSEGCALLSGAATAQSEVILSATGPLGQGDVGVVFSTAPFHLRGNPYASAIDFEAPAFQAMRTANSIANTFWTYNPANISGVYSVYNNGSITNVPAGHGTASVIAPGQAFFVQNNLAQTRAVANFFQDSYKTAAAQNGLFRGASGANGYGWQQLLRLGLYQAGAADTARLDETVIRFAQSGMQTDVIGALDAGQMSRGAQSLSSKKAGQWQSIQTRPVPTMTGDTVALSLTSNATGQYLLSISEQVDMTGVEVMLRDKFMGTQQPIIINQPVAVNVTSDPASQGSDRFELIFRSSAILAAKFISVSGEWGADKTTVKFTAQEDGNVKTFAVERSQDGSRFEAVASLKGSERAGQFRYVAEDAGATAGTLYYRIRANNANGTVDYSAIIKLSNHQIIKLALSPNPAKDVVTLKADGLSGKTSIRMTDASGRVVLSQPLTISGSGTQQLSVTSLAQGIYQVLVVSETGETLNTQKLIKL